MNSFYEIVKTGAERFPISGQEVPHFSELQIGADLYLQKCQILMHILEQLIGEQAFFLVAAELYNKAIPTVNVNQRRRVSN